MALNEVLYTRLVQKFGHTTTVEIVRPNEPYLPNWTYDPLTGRHSRDPESDGEAYRLNCFAGETKVITINGDRPISSLVGKATLLVPNYAGTGLWKEVEVKQFGKQKLLRLHLRRGRTKKMIRVTPDHRWLVRKKTIVTLTKDLKKGDRLLECFVRGISSYGDRSLRLSPVGIAHGFVFGDGSHPSSSGKPSSVVFHNEKDLALLKYFSSCQVTSRLTGGKRFPEAVGLPRYWKDFPPQSEALTYLYGWLAGYFAADGHVVKNGSTATLYSAKVENLEYAKSVLYRLGVRVSPIKSRLRKGYGLHSTVLHSLTFATKQLPLDFWLLAHHRASAESHAGKPDCGMFNRWVVDKVEDRGERGEVYCAVVPGADRFTLADNLVTMNCPMCVDRKGRLYVNHFWMQWDEAVFRHVDDMIKCFNDTDCFRKDPENRSRFWNMLFGDCDPSDLDMVIKKPEESVKEIVPAPPGKIIPLSKLHPQQPAIYYLRGRGYDTDFLSSWFHLGVVASVDFGHSSDCLNRIYVPMIHDGQLVGYQCRYIGDREWTAECPKYRTMPHMKRSKYLYNIDNASRSKMVVLVEGPSSTWAIGPRGLGLWGNSIHSTQVRHLKERWGPDCLIAVMLDGAAAPQSDKVTAQLRAHCRAKIVQIKTGFRDDPGNLREAGSWRVIQQTCEQQGIDLNEYLKGENICNQPVIPLINSP